jgi:hypothetical protein
MFEINNSKPRTTIGINAEQEILVVIVRIAKDKLSLEFYLRWAGMPAVCLLCNLYGRSAIIQINVLCIHTLFR